MPPNVALFTVLALMVACAGLAYAIASGRRADAGVWVMVSFILGPVGLLMTYLWAKPSR